MKENTLIYTREFEKGVDPVLKDGKLTIGDVTFTDAHSQDCCEHVYADWSPFEKAPMQGVTKVEVKAVEGMGIVFFLYDGHLSYSTPHRVGVLVNCYNSQNGYYSSDLELVILQKVSDDQTIETRIDVSHVVYDEVD